MVEVRLATASRFQPFSEGLYLFLIFHSFETIGCAGGCANFWMPGGGQSPLGPFRRIASADNLLLLVINNSVFIDSKSVKASKYICIFIVSKIEEPYSIDYGLVPITINTMESLTLPLPSHRYSLWMCFLWMVFCQDNIQSHIA